ncbi:MAG TPA: hypothetical protein VIQ31_14320 [Phormidium sp.]
MRCVGKPVWMPEIGLGIGRERGTFWGWQREWLYWYDADGRRFLSPDELTQQAAQVQGQAEQRTEQLAAQLRALGIEPAEG